MFAGINLAQIIGAIGLGLMAFVGAAFYMVNQVIDEQTLMPPLAVVNPGVPPQPRMYQPDATSKPPAESASPSRRSAKARRSPSDPAALADAFRLLGMAAEVRVTSRRGVKDPRLDALVRDTQSLTAEEIYPGAIIRARRLKQSLRSEYLDITPSNTARIEELVEVLGEPISTQADLGTPANRRMTWCQYGWFEFGVVGRRVLTLRLNCQMTPNYGLEAR